MPQVRFTYSTAITIPLLLGRVWKQLTLMLISLYAFEEFARAVGLWQERRHIWWARLLIVVLYVPVVSDRYGIFMAMPAYILLFSFVIAVMRDTYEGMIQRTSLTALGVLYFGWFTAHMGFLLNFADGAAALLVMLMLVVLNDASAYLIGSTIGRHKLSPNLSPNKTAEGMLGAMAVTVTATFALAWALPPMPTPLLALLGLLIALGGTLGDLDIGTPRGEYVVVLEGADPAEAAVDDDTVREALRFLELQGALRIKAGPGGGEHVVLEQALDTPCNGLRGAVLHQQSRAPVLQNLFRSAAAGRHDRLARGERLQTPLDMQMVRERYVDRINLRIVQQRFVA